MKFSIITPTYKRPDELKRCIESVLSQNHKDWEMIVTNDFPEISLNTNTSPNLSSSRRGTEQEKIKFFENEKNMGNNFSKNFAFTKISNDSDYVIFLDDDDWLSPNALHDLNVFLEKYKNENNGELKWLVTERVLNTPHLASPYQGEEQNIRQISYFWDYLLFRKIKGDKTHIISREILKQTTPSKSFRFCHPFINEGEFPRFSTKVKNGEEWFFFCQIQYKFIYYPLSTTLTNGYAENGLNAEMQKKYTENTWKLFREVKNFKIFLYLDLRLVNILKKLIFNLFR
jgi:glycosyltransferase involved in cell wall biosynthesis